MPRLRSSPAHQPFRQSSGSPPSPAPNSPVSIPHTPPSPNSPASVPSFLRNSAAVSSPNSPAPLVEPLRLVKDEDELKLMSEAALIGCQLFDHILTVIRPGIPEIEVAAELEYQARLHGAEGMSFETIVASGQRSALPHGKASAAPLPRRGFLTLDFGIIREGYCSDMTRTVCLGKPNSEERNAYEAVLEAQEAAVAAVAAGVSCGEVDEAARSVLRKAGMADAFSHSTGHGVGLEIHESPRVGGWTESKAAGGDGCYH